MQTIMSERIIIIKMIQILLTVFNTSYLLN